MFSRFLTPSAQEMTCEVPAQSVTQSCPISTGAKVVTVSCGVFTSVPLVSAPRILANLNLASPCSQITADFFAPLEL